MILKVLKLHKPFSRTFKITFTYMYKSQRSCNSLSFRYPNTYKSPQTLYKGSFSSNIYRQVEETTIFLYYFTNARLQKKHRSGVTAWHKWQKHREEKKILETGTTKRRDNLQRGRERDVWQDIKVWNVLWKWKIFYES